MFSPSAKAAAGASFQPFAASVVPLRSDGATVAAYMPTANTVRVVFKTGPGLTLAVPAGCAADPARLGDSGLRAVGGGYVLYYCPATFGTGLAGSTGYVVQSIATTQSQPAAGTLSSTDSGAPPRFDAIGSQWLGGFSEDHEGGVSPFDLRWRTGVQFAWPRHRLSISQVEDLDQARPAQRICAPLRRSTVPSPLGGTTSDATYFPYAYEHPWGAGIVRSGHLTVQHCGSKRRITIAPRGIGQLQGAGGVITWVSGSRRLAMHAYSPATRRSTTSGPSDTSLIAQHLGDVLFASTVATRVGAGNLTPTMWTITAAHAFSGP
jgi:hypothetical protein